MSLLRLKGRVWLTEAAAEAIVELARRAHPRETGGVLVGVLCRDQPWITAAVEIPTERSNSSYYELPKGARLRAVAHLRRSDSRIGYLGEWHSHPDDVGPSGVDTEATARVARDPAAAGPRPVLIVARRVGPDYELDARQVRGPRVRPVRLIAAGKLPAAADRP